jgi:iron complex transport system substrate-binding protein
MMRIEEQRIVSLIPSATEIVCALGLRERLVGVSHECDYPPGVELLPAACEPKLDPKQKSAEIDRSVRAILEQALSVYRVKTDVLSQLEPTLIVTQDQCHVCAVSLGDVEAACATLGFKKGATPSSTQDARAPHVVSLVPETLADIERDFALVAKAAGVPKRGEALLAAFREQLAAVRARVAGSAAVKVVLVEWLAPPMVAGGWMPELARIAGGEPLIVSEARRFTTVGWGHIAAADPDAIVILPCGFDLERTLSEIETSGAGAELRKCRATREGRTFAVDGNAYFNRPGPRIAESAELLARALHPECFETPDADLSRKLRRWPS